MKMWNKHSWSALILAFGILQIGEANVDPGKHGTGLKDPTSEQLEAIKKLPKVVRVNPNKIGAARITHFLESLGATPISMNTSDVEIITNQDDEGVQYAPSVTTLPTYVDNSTLPSFPPIGDQGQEGSCTAWGSTYYHATHEVGLMNGYNNKTSSSHILSPKWTYNMCNGGVDDGAYPPDAYLLLSQNGAPSSVNFPYNPINVTAWDLNTADWIAAMSNRTSRVAQVYGIGGATQDLTQIKQLLANGHVVTFATYAYSWQYSQILRNPNANADNRFVGQYAVSWMQGTAGGHFVTIVGYNDNLWVDVNGNGKVDPGEMGAFLVANSWGNWANSGFIWMSYDAFLNTSAVPNGPSSGRVALASFYNNVVFSTTAKSANYTPQLVAEFSLTSSARDHLMVQGGISDSSHTTPSSSFTSGAIRYQGGALGFNGMSGSDTATFALDLTDLKTATPGDNRFYLVATNNQSGAATLNSFSLIDYTTKTTTNYTNVPLSFANNTLYLYLDDMATPKPAPTPTNPVVTITSPANHATVSCTVPISATITGNSLPLSWVALYVNSTPVLVDTSAPFTFLYDTTKLTNGTHNFLIIAEDTMHNSGQSTITLTVHNGCP